MTISPLPHHVAIIMDGNGRWAKARLLPRAAGHRRGVSALECITESAARAGVKVLTVFAFSSENWARPKAEVTMLMKLFASSLKDWAQPLKEAGVALRVVGDKTAFSDELNEVIADTERETADGTRMTLNVAANYGGRWDMIQATKAVLAKGKELTPEAIEAELTVPAVDLMIRTVGEYSISNFLLWQSAYAEIFISDVLWPEFNEANFLQALTWYSQRERRFGRTSEQLEQTGN